MLFRGAYAEECLTMEIAIWLWILVAPAVAIVAMSYMKPN